MPFWPIYSLAALSAMFAVYEMAFRIRSKSERRTAELEQVEVLLNDHYDALEYVLKDPASPDEMKEVLLALSEAISQRKMAEYIVSRVFDKNSDLRDGLETDIDALRRSRPELVGAMEKAISTGFSAMILRWPETSRRAEIFMSEMLRKDKDRAIARAVRQARECEPELGAGPIPAAA